MQSKLDYKAGIYYQLNRPYTGDAWAVKTFYKDVAMLDVFAQQTEAKLYAERYLASTGDIAEITKYIIQDGQLYAHG